MKKPLIAMLLFFTMATQSFCRVYYAYWPLESDTVLTFWLLHRYSDPSARLIGVEKGKTINAPDHLQINTPTAYYRRTSRFSAYENTRRVLRIEDTCARFYDRIARILEMSSWRKQEYPDLVRFERNLHRLLPAHPGEQQLTRVFRYLNTYCTKEP
jgi:hypothetical protein